MGAFFPLLCSRFEAQTCRENGPCELQLKENTALNFGTASLVLFIHAQVKLIFYVHYDANENNKGTPHTMRSIYPIWCAAYCENLTIICFHIKVLKTTQNGGRVARTFCSDFLTLSSPSDGVSSGHCHSVGV